MPAMSGHGSWLLACALAGGGPGAAPAPAEGPGEAQGPAVPPPRTIEEQGPSPYHYRKPPEPPGAAFRLGFGGSFAASRGLPPPRTRFTLDVLLGLDVGLARGSKAGVLIEGGYSYAYGGQHFFVLGAGPTVRHFGPTLGLGRRGQLVAGLLAHGLFGKVAGQRAGGVRTSVVFHALAWMIEVGHQYVAVGEQSGHEVRLTLGVSFFELGGRRS